MDVRRCCGAAVLMFVLFDYDIADAAQRKGG